MFVKTSPTLAAVCELLWLLNGCGAETPTEDEPIVQIPPSTQNSVPFILLTDEITVNENQEFSLIIESYDDDHKNSSDDLTVLLTSTWSDESNVSDSGI